jgi:hypothetical protein
MALQFKLVTEFLQIGTRAFPLADPSILLPSNAEPLVAGEFLQLDTAYKMARGTGEAVTVPSYCYFLEQGAYTAQGLGKGPFLYMHEYEADTLIMDDTTLAVGSPLMVGDVTIGSGTKRGVKLNDTPATKYTVGIVTRLPANNNGYLRFRRVG